MKSLLRLLWEWRSRNKTNHIFTNSSRVILFISLANEQFTVRYRTIKNNLKHCLHDKWNEQLKYIMPLNVLHMTGLFTMLIVFVLRVPSLQLENMAFLLDWLFMVLFPHYAFGVSLSYILIKNKGMDGRGHSIENSVYCYRKLIHVTRAALICMIAESIFLIF